MINVSFSSEGSADDYHGIRVVDPFRWLEDGAADEVHAWIARQNALTRMTLDAIGGRSELHQRLTTLLHVGSLSAPTMRITRSGVRRYFQFRRGGGQDQGVYYVRDGICAADRPLIDIAALSSADNTTSLAWTAASPDGSFVAWGRSDGGSEDCTLYVRDVFSGVDLADRIPHTRNASIAWLSDEQGFFYTRHPEFGTVPSGDERYLRKVYLHRLGADSASDIVVFPPRSSTITCAKTDLPSVFLSPDGRWLVVRVHRSAYCSRVYVVDRFSQAPERWIEIATQVDSVSRPIVRNDALYLVTNSGAPRGRLVAVDYERPEAAAWREIIPEAEDVLHAVSIVGGVIVANYLRDAATRLECFSMGGCRRGCLELPSAGLATVHGHPDGDEAFVKFTSFVAPGIVLRFDLETGDAGTLWGQVGAHLELSDIVVRRAWATSRDGTRVPMFIVERKGTRQDGCNPTILTGYGGFNRSVSPAFNPNALVAVERGAVWVLAVLRGGGEYGDAWHRAGLLTGRQNVFDDFIACAEELVRSGVTSASRLGIIGSSNGGLLVAAAVTQRPDLFRAAVCDVPLTDMLRYQHFIIGKMWATEFGTSDDPEQFRTLLAYSPYHRVRDGTVYPSMLFVTAESDSRVDPMHARKMTARMQAAQSGAAHRRPILIRSEANAGHGRGKPISRVVDEFTDEMSFLFDAIGCMSAHPFGSR